jgi:hypothetical protein
MKRCTWKLIKMAMRQELIEIGKYFHFYNTERPHQTLGYKTPAEVFSSNPVENTCVGVVESRKLAVYTTNQVRMAGPYLNLGPFLFN